MVKYVRFFTLAIGWLLATCSPERPSKRILVFSKTTGYRHAEAIIAGVGALADVSARQGYHIDTTERTDVFCDDSLKRYGAVVFLNVSGDVFTNDERNSLRRFVQAGGGFLAIHGAADAERKWPWYGKLLGGYFESQPLNPNVRTGRLNVCDTARTLLDGLPPSFEVEDEFYNFELVNPDVQVLLTVDESSYEGGTMGDEHPIVWSNTFDGGRSFYIGLGHTPEIYGNAHFREILEKGLSYVMPTDRALDYSKSIPHENRFEKHTVLEGLNEPMGMSFANRDIYIAERRGDIVHIDGATGDATRIGTIPVKTQGEDGLLNIAVAPDFRETRHLYVYYSALGDDDEFRIARFTVTNSGALEVSSEKILLRIPKQTLSGSHTGGGLAFDPSGKYLYIAVGDNTNPYDTPFAPIDSRPDRLSFDAQRSSANTNDLRGKILRIIPKPDGTYEIPEGNLFPPGLDRTRPEIYSMGHRQPWRLHVDDETGWLFFGEVGPDARDDSVGLGPKGYDEFNLIKEPGNYGWPYFIGDTLAYHAYDFETKKSGEPFDRNAPLNQSPNNTGLERLPPAKGAFMWYPYEPSDKFQDLGSGGRSAVGGPVFRRNRYASERNPELFPPYYDGKWFITDWVRGWIMAVSFDENGDFASVEPFLPSQKLDSPIDLKMGPDGTLYVLEYGNGWFQKNPEAKLARIHFNNGNREPQAKITADTNTGALPLVVALSADSSRDFDGDRLRFDWTVLYRDTPVYTQSNRSRIKVAFSRPGVYQAILKATDPGGLANRDTLEIVAGNSQPEVWIDIVGGNQTFFFPNRNIAYRVSVADREDSGDDKAFGLDSSEIRVYAEYARSVKSFGKRNDIRGPGLINRSDCYTCHSIQKKSIGPAFKEIADRYADDPSAKERLPSVIINGGKGNWGEVPMSPHPDINMEDAHTMVDYILNLSAERKPAKLLPLTGNYVFNDFGQDERDEREGFVLRASYRDRGLEGKLPRLVAADTAIFRSPIWKFSPFKRSTSSIVPDNFVFDAEPYFYFGKVDLTDIKEVKLSGLLADGQTVELCSGGARGALIASARAKQGIAQLALDDDLAGFHELYLVFRNGHRHQFSNLSDEYEVVFVNR